MACVRALEFFEQRPRRSPSRGEVADRLGRDFLRRGNRLGPSPQYLVVSEISAVRISVLEGVEWTQPLFTQTVDDALWSWPHHPDRRPMVLAVRASVARFGPAPQNWVGVCRASVG